jgi:hypothetical protein
MKQSERREISKEKEEKAIQMLIFDDVPLLA